jgi:hypothetical protein
VPVSANQLKSLDILIGDSTGKKYAQPLLIKENPTGEVSKIEGTNASVKLIGLDTFAAFFWLRPPQSLVNIRQPWRSQMID